MINLNKYYNATTYQGASSSSSEGRSGFVPKALSGDNIKYLRGDGTWQSALSVLPNHGNKHLNAAAASFSGVLTTIQAYASFIGSVAGAEELQIFANEIGTIGNNVFLLFDDSGTDIDTAISNWNTDNPSNTIYLNDGDGSQIPESDIEIILSGGLDSINLSVVITADNNSSAGNNISLYFNGEGTIDTVISNWNSANPSNTAALVTGDGNLIPEETTITLSGGADGTDPVFDQNLNTTDTVEFNQVNTNVYLSGGVDLATLFGQGGGGGSAVRRFDYATVSNIDYSYSGTAPYGTAENTPIWKLIRLTYANNGTIFNSASATNTWTGHLTAAYI